MDPLVYPTKCPPFAWTQSSLKRVEYARRPQIHHSSLNISVPQLVHATISREGNIMSSADNRTNSDIFLGTPDIFESEYIVIQIITR